MNWPAFIDRIEIRFPMPMQVEYIPTERAVIFWARIVAHDTGEATWMRSVAYPAPDTMTEAQALDLIRYGLQSWVLHEIDECLYLDGRRPWDPHVSQPQPCRCAACVTPNARTA